MIDAMDIKKGMNIKVEGQLYFVMDMQHHKPGKGGAMMRTKIKNLKTGTILERSFRGGDKIEEFTIDRKKYQFLYSDAAGFHFMDMETYEQLKLSGGQVGRLSSFMRENMEVDVLLYEGETIGIELPKNVEVKVVYTEPGHRGDTATNVMKPAKLETGLEVLVPLFIDNGDIIVIDVDTGKYVSRK